MSSNLTRHRVSCGIVILQHKTVTSYNNTRFHIFSVNDTVRCFCCALTLRKWSRGEDPWIEHARYTEHCDYLVMTRGQEFVSNAAYTYRVKTVDDLVSLKSDLSVPVTASWLLMATGSDRLNNKKLPKRKQAEMQLYATINTRTSYLNVWCSAIACNKVY